MKNGAKQRRARRIASYMRLVAYYDGPIMVQFMTSNKWLPK